MTHSIMKTACRSTLIAFGLLAGLRGAEAQNPQSSSLTAEQTYALAREAYLYAYPIVSMDVTMRQATNVPGTGTINMRAPINQFAHARAYPKADEKDVVRYNFDTLYSFAWLDLAREPVILSAPDTGGRYYLLPMLDMWTDVFSVVGTRTTGNKAGTYAIVAPGWAGTLPDGMTKIVAPTSAIWILGRTQTNGPADYDAVHKVQDGYKLTPLSQWGKDSAPSRNLPVDPTVDNKTPPLVQVNNLDGVAMLTRLADLMVKYPPHPNDYGANVIEDALYPTAFADADGQPFSSDRRYVLHFAKDQIPPVRGFWSLTMYDARQLFTANPIDRYAIGDRDKLAFNADGSLDLYIQSETPGKDKEANWLPAPKSGAFTMNLRLYWPKTEATNGTWAPPPVKRVN